MNIPKEYPSDVQDKLKAVDLATQKNLSTLASLEAQITTADLQKASNLTGVVPVKYSTKSTLAGLPAAKTGNEETFFSKNKWYLIGGGVLITIAIVLFILKRKGMI